MNIQGKFVKLGTLTEGTSARGAWRKQELIIQTEEQYPKTVCLTCWGDTIDAIANLTDGDRVSASISIESREFNGKWYTDVRAWRVQPKQEESAPAVPPMPEMPPFGEEPQYASPASSAAEVDDLPF